MDVRDITIKLTIEHEYGPDAQAALRHLLTDQWPDWVVGARVISGETRPATEEEAESMGWTES